MLHWMSAGLLSSGLPGQLLRSTIHPSLKVLSTTFVPLCLYCCSRWSVALLRLCFWQLPPLRLWPKLSSPSKKGGRKKGEEINCLFGHKGIRLRTGPFYKESRWGRERSAFKKKNSKQNSKHKIVVICLKTHRNFYVSQRHDVLRSCGHLHLQSSVKSTNCHLLHICHRVILPTCFMKAMKLKAHSTICASRYRL